MIDSSAIVWAGFVLGFAGSMHCIGMCGPIALALPVTSHTKTGFILSRLLYNFGRVLTYSFFGFAIGVVGGMIRIAGLQEWISISTGIIIILATIFPRIFKRFFPNASLINKPIQKVKSLFAGFLQTRSNGALFALGLLNGLLPCGFVYVALAGALNTDSAFHSIAFMALFGIGTLPAMLAVSLLPQFAKPNFRTFIKKLTPIIAIAMGVIFIIRGMGLDIPYLSPKLQAEKPAQSDCCRHHNR